MKFASIDPRSLSSRLVSRIESARARQQLIRDFERLMLSARPGASSGPAIGFATFGSGGWHFVLEALLAHALRRRGARPSMLICDLPGVPVCDERSIYSRDHDHCAGCIGDKRELIQAAQLPWNGVSSFVPADAIAGARTTADSLPASQIESFQFRGWPVGQWLHVSASHFLRGDARGDDPEKVESRRRQLATAMVIVTAVEGWLDRVRPDIVIAESGAHLMWRIARELSGARGIPVVCREMGKGGWDHHLYALNRDCMAPDLSAEWNRVKNVPLHDSDEAAVDAYVDALPARTFVDTRPHDDASHGLAIPATVKVVVAFTNVTWDLATAGRDAGFTGVLDWIGETMAIVAQHPAVHLIVRAHPAEAAAANRERIVDLIAEQWPVLPPNVTVLGPEHLVAAKDLCDRADLVLVYNSTAGLEAAIRGKAVMVAGDPHYGDKGFTRDIRTRDEYRNALDGWASGDRVSPPPASVDLARRYFHLFFLRYHVPMGWTTSPLEPPYALVIQSIDELEPGRNPALDLVCRAILDGRQVLLPGAGDTVPAICVP